MIGQTVSHYEILEKLGEGGMGVVFKARDLRLDRFVALKFLPPAVTESPESIARFESEARAISALNHPNIACIYAMEEDAGRRFLVLEYLAGGTLRSRMKDFRALGQPFPIQQAVSIAIEMAEGLGHAHRNGIVHRDIKPENVMFSADGRLRITDFGIAKSARSPVLTVTGAAIGTAAYMAPEQALANETSPQSDLFSMGVVLHEIIAGRRPFIGTTDYATVHSVLHDEAPALHQLRADCGPEVERIVLRLLEKDRSKRYQTADQVIADLSALHMETATAQFGDFAPTQTMVLAVKPDRRRRKLILAGAVAGVAIIAAFTALDLHSKRSTQHEQTQLAVLPFTARSGHAADSAFGSGLSEILATRLAGADSNLWIVPQSDLARNRVGTPAEARRIFGVPLVLTGVVDRQGSGKTHVEMNLIDSGSGKVLRSAAANASDSGTDLQGEIMKRATELIGIRAKRRDISRDDAGTGNAYDYYVLGSGYLQRYDQPGNLGSAIASFRKAIELDPSYALAYAGLGSAYWRQYRQSNDPQYLEQAREASIQALSRNENLDIPHITLGAIAVTTGQVDEGIRQLRIALNNDPVNAEACRELAAAWVAAGRLSEAEETYKRAIQFRPGFWLGYLDLATFYNDHARYGEAEDTLRKAAGLTPDNYLVWRNLGGVQMARGEWNEAEASFKKAIALSPHATVYSNLGALYIYLGRYADAIPVLEQAVALGGGDRNAYLIWGNLGDAYKWTSHRADASRAYAKAIDLALAQLAVNPNDGTVLGRIAVFYAKMGDAAHAEDRIRSAMKASPRDPGTLYRSAIVMELAGRRRQSLAALDAALASGYSLHVAEHEPELASLRNDAGFRAIAAHAKEEGK